MKRIKIQLLFVFIAVTGNTQNYMIDFAGAGASESVDSVKVENLTQCTSLTIGGTDILLLGSSITETNSYDEDVNFTQVFPNPSTDCFTIEISSDIATEANVVLYDISGKQIFSKNCILKKGIQKYRIDGLYRGIFILRIESNHLKYSAKLISLSNVLTSAELTNIELREIASNTNVSNNIKARRNLRGKSIVSMYFNEGDTLKLTGKSGIYTTIKMLFPSGDETLTFHFVDCTDADGNHYAVVQIGSQLWMAENLKTTRYRDGSYIPNIPDSATWGNLSSGAYCNYHNDTAEGNYYGRLYNFYAVADSRNIAPAGWHVASNSEWNILEVFLDPTVDTSATAWMGRGTVIGRILKEGCNTRWQYYEETYGWNSVGFTALCSNFRNNTGAWSLAPDNNHDNAFWTSTSYSTNTAWGLSLRWCFGDIYAIPLINMRQGESVRCVKD